MFFNENIYAGLMLSQLNLFVSDTIYDEQKMLKICNLATSIKARSVTVDHLFIPKIWKWIEKSNIGICAFINLDNFIENSILNKNKVFISIKNAITNGATLIDVYMSNYFNLDEYLDFLTIAVGGKNNLIKLTMDKVHINNSEKIKDFLDKIYNKNFFNIKTEFFSDKNDYQNKFKTKISDINIVFDFIHEKKLEKIFKIDIVSNYLDENGFNFYNSIKMLYLSIFYESESLFYKNNTFTYNPLRLNKILQ